MSRHSFDFGSAGRVQVMSAWTPAQVKTEVEWGLERFAEVLPEDLGTGILIKPNMNNDLAALIGNSTDLRVLCSLIEALKNRGYHRIQVADGSNVGVHRRGINTFARLRIDKLVPRYGVSILDLNQDGGVPVPLQAGARPKIARAIMDAEFLISVPKIKTHAEAGLSCALKNWVGICTGQDKREMHRDLGRNIMAINEVVKPDLILVDGLVGMEGNGPGDGEPFRLGHLMMSTEAFTNDVVACRLVGMPIERVPYLEHAIDAGLVSAELLEQSASQVPVLRQIRPAPQRSRLAELSEARSLNWLKLAVRPVVDNPRVSRLAYRAGIIQDRYNLQDDSITGLHLRKDKCDDCGACAEVCPTHLSAEEIGVKTEPEDCIQCLYCWWACPQEALELDGELHYMEAHAARYKEQVEALCS